MAGNEALRSKSPTRQSCYGDGALQDILAKANKKAGPNDPAFLKYLVYFFVVLGFILLSFSLLLSLPDLRSGMCE